MTSIELKGTTLYPAYKYQEEVETTVMATVVGKEEEDGAEEKRAPLDVVLVLDKSGSMSGRKLELCKETCSFLIKELGKNDRFGMVTFDSEVSTDFKLCNMDETKKQEVELAIDRIRAGSCTNLSGGLLAGLRLFEEAPPVRPAMPTAVPLTPRSGEGEAVEAQAVSEEEATKNDRVRAIIALTDGHANEGITGALPLSNIVKSALEKFEGSTVKLFTFGYGTDHDEKLLETLAEYGNGSYYFVEKVDDVAGAFSDCLGGLLSVVAQSIQLRIEPAGGSVILNNKPIGCKFKVESDNTGFTVSIPDLYSGEKRNILFKVKLPALTAPVNESGDAPVAKLVVNFADALQAKMETIEQIVGVARPGEVDEKVLKEEKNSDLEMQLLRIETAEAMERAQQEADRGNYAASRNILDHARNFLEESPMYAQENLLGCMRDDVMEQMNLTNTTSWFSSGTKLSKNLCHQYNHERATKSKMSANVYRNRKQKECRSKVDSHIQSRQNTTSTGNSAYGSAPQMPAYGSAPPAPATAPLNDSSNTQQQPAAPKKSSSGFGSFRNWFSKSQSEEN